MEDQLRLKQLLAANRAEFLKTPFFSRGQVSWSQRNIATWACVVESTSACNAFRYRSRRDRASGTLWTLCNDALFDGRLFRMLTVVDQYSRQSSMVEAAFAQSARASLPRSFASRSRCASVDGSGPRHRLHVEGTRGMGVVRYDCGSEDASLSSGSNDVQTKSA